MLDLGANTECDANNLVQFAVMGAAYARTALDIERPEVALLNIGTEELKGTDELKDAAAMLRARTHAAADVHRLHRGRPHCRAATSTSSSPTVSRAISRSRPPRAPRASSPICCAAPSSSSFRSKMGFLLSQPATAPAARPSRPEQSQWRGLPRAQRPGGEEPWRRQRQGRRQRDRRRCQAGARRPDTPYRRAILLTIARLRPSKPWLPNDRRLPLCHRPPRRDRRHRLRAARAPRHQRRTGRDRRHHRTSGSSSAPASAPATSPADDETTATLATDAARARARGGRHRRRAKST